eukprot:scaffold1307_cov200-Pinguiococcus_pyrenoidosus.AAC.51
MSRKEQQTSIVHPLSVSSPLAVPFSVSDTEKIRDNASCPPLGYLHSPRSSALSGGNAHRTTNPSTYTPPSGASRCAAGQPQTIQLSQVLLHWAIG